MAEGIARFLGQPGRVHLMGIGGVGMAGLARLLMQAGCTVSGSDAQSNRLTRQLAAEGVRIFEGHDAQQVFPLPDFAIRTPALGEGNVEVDRLRAHQIPVFVRGQVLAAYSHAYRSIAVAGAHGKTTTSSMMASILYETQQGSGYAVGGETSLPGRVADRGDGDCLVFEADESDGTLVYYAPEVGFLTHVEWDHIERFRSEDALLACYRRFVGNCERVWIREGDVLAERVCEGHSKIFRVGESAQADLQLCAATSDAMGQNLELKYKGELATCRLCLPGKHNAWNALMAIAGAAAFGVSVREACEALEKFQGVARRFQKVDKNGVMLIQDYAHHPTEIRAVMASVACLNPARLWVVFQPHRFSRTQHLLADFVDAFAGADALAMLPVYAASELASQGVGSELLVQRCREKYDQVEAFADRATLVKKWAPHFKAGDVVLIVGAGDVEALQSEFVDVL
ncbi:UDP-N-acetylmuramate--L-alanine ligase [Kiritimatiellota bacterium B12222]|nr:UDP-N-acetylmuramate--L-alanine ligase [Kiritimatiellota bacterium B12222]